MIFSIIKHFSIILCTFFIYAKIIDHKPKEKAKETVFIIAYSALISSAEYFLRAHFAPLNLAMGFVSVFLITMFMYKSRTNDSFCLTTISYVVSYAAYYIATLICTPLLYFLFRYINSVNVLNFIAVMLSGILQFAMCIPIFKIKLLKNGISMVRKISKDEITSYICFLVLFLVALAYSRQAGHIVFTIILLTIVFCGVVVAILLTKHIKNIYIEKVNLRNQEVMDNLVEEKENAIRELEEDNKKYSEILLKDNKIIPEMQRAIEELLKCKSFDEQRQKSKPLLKQLNELTDERDGMVANSKVADKLSESGLSSTDACIKYIFKECKESDINFVFEVHKNLKEFANSPKAENDLNTVLLDLAENAVIAVKEAETKNIKISFESANNVLSINVYDSGDMFEPNTIKNLGLRRTTTHKDDGGYGNGLMNTMEFCHRYEASLLINELNDNKDYTKSVSVNFDYLNKIKIHSQNPDIIRAIKGRNDVVLF